MATGHPLKSLVSRANKTLGTIADRLKSIDGRLQSIDNTMESGFEQVDESIQKQTEAQAELTLMEYVAEVASVKAQIESEHEHVQDEQADLDQRLAEIGERYQGKHDDLDEKAERRIRDLGEHIFEIDEDEFDEGIEQPFFDHVTETWADLQQHNAKTGERRDAALREALDDAGESIDGFVDRRSNLLQRIDDHRTDLGAGGDEATRIDVPYFVVTIVEDGVERDVVVPPSRLTDREEGWLDADLEELPGFREPVERIREKPLQQSSTPHLRDDQLADAVDQYGQRSLAGQVSYADAFRDALPEQLPYEQAVE